MKIAVCVKQVLYTGGPFEIDRQSGLACLKDTEPIYTTSVADRSMLEEALILRDEIGGEVIALTMGPAGAVAALHICLARGADRAIHLLDDESLTNDPYRTGWVLSRAIAEEGFDLILCGTKSPDEGSSQLPSILAELLVLPQVTGVIKMEVSASEKKVQAVRRLERGRRERVECPLPAVIGGEPGIREPGYVSVWAQREAMRRKIETRPVASFNMGCQAAPLTRVVDLTQPRPRVKKTPRPDAQMSAAQRINFILGGGMAKKEKALLLEGPLEKMVDQVLDTLEREGIRLR